MIPKRRAPPSTKRCRWPAARERGFVFAHVVSTLGDEFVPDTTEPERMTTAGLRDAVRRARLYGVPCNFELLFGDAPTQIDELAEDLDVDLIIVGSRHRKGIARALPGSTSRAILSKSTPPDPRRLRLACRGSSGGDLASQAQGSASEWRESQASRADWLAVATQTHVSAAP